MKLNIKNKQTIDKEQLKASANSDVESRYWIKDFHIVNDSLLFESKFSRDKKYLTLLENESFKFIDLKPFENKHKHRVIKTQDKNGENVWEEPEYPRNLVDYSSTNYVSFTHQNRFGLLNLFNLYIWDDIDAEPIKINISKQLKTKKGTDSKGNDFYKDLNIIKVGRSTIKNQISVIFSTYSSIQYTQYFTVLEFNTVTKTAHWKYIENEMPLNLDLDEYPHTKYQKEFGENPIITDVLWNGKSFITTTWGCGIKYIGQLGYDCKMLLEANTLGKRNKILLEPKEIIKSIFPSNSNYVILKPYYKKYGKPYIYHLETKEYILPKLPRDYSKFEVFEITEDSIWLMQEENEKVEIIQCELN